MKKYILIIAMIFLIGMTNKKEIDYQNEFCVNGIKEYVLKDKSRIDCLTDTYAIEIDFSKKVYECIGQSIYYSIETNRKPACALIFDKNNKSDIRYLKRLKVVAKKYDIKIFIIDK